jgi:integrase
MEVPGYASLGDHLVLAAFRYAEAMSDVASPLKGLKKPTAQPLLQFFSREDEVTLLNAADEQFRNFLFAAIHTGLRPYCELAMLTADHVEVTPCGMLWRAYSSKTKKSRKIPVRAEMASLVQKSLPGCPKGSTKPIFRNTKDEPWKQVTPAILFCDKIDKALAGVTGSGQGDSGASARLFGTLLTWLNRVFMRRCES